MKGGEFVNYLKDYQLLLTDSAPWYWLDLYRFCVDRTFTTVQIFEERNELNLETFISFIDYGKGFDRREQS
jgi:hypothetical protein